MQFLLVHSPLVGPTTWRWVAGALAAAGHEVALPDLRAAVSTGAPSAFAASVGEAVPTHWSNPIVVGHSGAGFFLPLIARHVASARLVFVDAGIPPCDGRATVGGGFLFRLRELAVGGTLPRWSTWWGDNAMRSLVPDDDRRDRITEEMPEVPMAFYEAAVDMPAGWCDRPAGFLLLSEAYREDADRAGVLGWPVVERLGGHLDIVADPTGVAGAIGDLARRSPLPSEPDDEPDEVDAGSRVRTDRPSGDSTQ